MPVCLTDVSEVLTLKFETKMNRAEKSHYQSEVFVCVSTNRADVVDWLLIELGIFGVGSKASH